MTATRHRGTRRGTGNAIALHRPRKDLVVAGIDLCRQDARADFERRLATIESADQAKKLSDEFDVMLHLLKKVDAGLDLQNECAYFKIVTQRQVGVLLARVPRLRNRKQGGRGIRSAVKQIGISTETAHRFEKFAKLPKKQLDRLAARCHDKREELTSARVYEAACQWAPSGSTDEHDGRTRVSDTYSRAVDRFLVAVRGAEETPERFGADIQRRHDEVRVALARFDRAIEERGTGR